MIAPVLWSLGALLASAVMGPVTLQLARLTTLEHQAQRFVETAAITSSAGLLAVIVVHEPHTALVLLPLALLGPAAALVDSYEGRLPDLLTGLLLASTSLAATMAGPHGARGIAVAGITAIGAVALKLLAGDLLGWGDVKLIPTLAIVLGHQDALLRGLLHTVTLVAVTAIVIGPRSGRRAVPYGPGLVLGTVGAAVGL